MTPHSELFPRPTGHNQSHNTGLNQQLAPTNQTSENHHPSWRLIRGSCHTSSSSSSCCCFQSSESRWERPSSPRPDGDELAFKPTCGCENLMTCLHRLWNLHLWHEVSGSLQSAGVCTSRLIGDVWGIFKWSEGSHKASGVIFTARFLTFLFILSHFKTKIDFVCFQIYNFEIFAFIPEQRAVHWRRFPSFPLKTDSVVDSDWQLPV